MKSVRTAAQVHQLLNDKMRVGHMFGRLSSTVAASRISKQEDATTTVLQNPQILKRSLQKSQCRGSATQTNPNSQLSRRTDLKANSQRNLHQMAVHMPEFIPAFAPEIREFTCEVAESSDKDEAVDFICKHFLKREPLMKALGITAMEARSFVEYNVKDALKDRASFVTRDSTTGEICGVRLNAVGHAEGMGKDVLLTPRLHTLVQFLSHVDGLLPEELEKSKFMRHIAICVNPDIARSGVGTLMMQKSVEYSKRHGLEYMIAMCSGRIATGLASKVGFQTIRQVPYDSYVDPIQSFTLFNESLPIKPFLSLVEEHTCANLMVKKV